LNTFKTTVANSEVRNANNYGVLKLTLHPTGYDWQFVAVDGTEDGKTTDSGTGSCSGTPPPSPGTEPPTVESTIPSANETDVAPVTNVTATFSEDMMASSITGETFKLFKKGSNTKIAATVSYDASTDTATLDPTNSLQSGITYKAVVTKGAKDLAGNSLDQTSTKTGLQQKAWFFTTSN
jgi:hypothetical protein